MSDDNSEDSGAENNGGTTGGTGQRGAGVDGGSPQLDALFEVLANRRRRYLLYGLHERDEPIELTELAKEVAAWEVDTTPESVPDETWRRVYTDLHHTQIPLLVDAGIVDYDPRSEMVRYWHHASLFNKFMEFAAWIERPDR